jgi:hypothetical protein
MHLGVSNTMALFEKRGGFQSYVRKWRKSSTSVAFANYIRQNRLKPQSQRKCQVLERKASDRPFEVTGVDFAGPLYYKITKKEDGKCYVLIFTCAASRAVHLEVTKDQAVAQFQRKLDVFITRRTRPRMIISDNSCKLSKLQLNGWRL